MRDANNDTIVTRFHWRGNYRLNRIEVPFLFTIRNNATVFEVIVKGEHLAALTSFTFYR